MGCTPLHFASLYANTKGAEVLIKLGADVNAANDRGSTPLHVRLGYVFKSSKGTGMDCLSSTLFPRDFITRTMEIILMLVSNGGDIYAENLNGCTPLSLVAGLTADANILIQRARVSSQRYLHDFQEPMPVEQVVRTVCDYKQAYTQFGGLRPFGVAFLFAGWDKHHGFQLYQSDPSGNYSGWKATVIGEWTESLALSETC